MLIKLEPKKKVSEWQEFGGEIQYVWFTRFATAVANPLVIYFLEKNEFSMTLTNTEHSSFDGRGTLENVVIALI